jgi:signal peptidase II
MTNPVPGRSPYLWIAGVVVALDQVTKALVDDLMALHESRPIVEGLVRLTYVQNRGAAFGILSEAGLPYQSVMFSMVSVLALLAIALYAWRMPVQSRLPQTALALVMGGAVGNLLDRARLGYVIDYMDVYWGPHHWPAFNVADSAISVGVTLLVIDILRNPQPISPLGAAVDSIGPLAAAAELEDSPKAEIAAQPAGHGE